MSNQIVKGNTAVIIGALYAGCDCFFGYPITQIFPNGRKKICTG